MIRLNIFGLIIFNMGAGILLPFGNSILFYIIWLIGALAGNIGLIESENIKKKK